MLSRAPSCPVNCSRATRTSTHLWGFQSHHHCRAPVFTHTDCGTGPGGQRDASQAGPWGSHAQLSPRAPLAPPSLCCLTGGSCPALPAPPLHPKDKSDAPGHPTRSQASEFHHPQSVGWVPRPLLWMGKLRPGGGGVLCLAQRRRVSQWQSWDPHLPACLQRPNLCHQQRCSQVLCAWNTAGPEHGSGWQVDKRTLHP